MDNLTALQACLILRHTEIWMQVFLLISTKKATPQQGTWV